jgi:hypothetical protein
VFELPTTIIDFDVDMRRVEVNKVETNSKASLKKIEARRIFDFV